MRIDHLPVDSLFFDQNNARHHDQKNIESIKGSLKRFGQQKPIVIDKDNIVIAGNGTLQAAKELGWDTIGVVVSSLENMDKMAFALADNRTAELASWDMPRLEEQLGLIEDPELIGFDDNFLPDPDFSPGSEEDQPRLDKKNPKVCPACGHEF